MDKWHPMETAPKDGTNILAFDPADTDEVCQGYVVVRWHRDEWVEASGEQYQTYKPTHWMPLPGKPT